MPRTLLSKNSSANKYRKLLILVNGAMVADNKDAEDIGQALNMSENTVRKYLGAPEKLPVEKLLKLGRNLGIPIDELRECIRY